MFGRRSNSRQIILGAAFACIALFYAFEIWGRTASLAGLLTIVFATFASGISFGRIRERQDTKKGAAKVKMSM